jgi:hypothetical protein
MDIMVRDASKFRSVSRKTKVPWQICGTRGYFFNLARLSSGFRKKDDTEPKYLIPPVKSQSHADRRVKPLLIGDAILDCGRTCRPRVAPAISEPLARKEVRFGCLDR